MSYASSILGLLPGGRRAPGIAQLVSKIENYLPADQVERVRDAFDYAEVAHKGQKRQSGEAYITHPIAVADILADLHLDGATLTAAILHDVVEDTPSSMAEVEQKFGKEVAEIVDGVTKLEQVQFKSRKEAQAESFRKMILAMVRDIRVIMVKLADRTHNMRTIAAMSPEKRRSCRARNARHLRTDRESPGHPLAQARARGTRIPHPLPAALPRHRAGTEARPRQPARVPAQDRQGAAPVALGRERQWPRRGAREASI